MILTARIAVTRVEKARRLALLDARAAAAERGGLRATAKSWRDRRQVEEETTLKEDDQ